MYFDSHILAGGLVLVPERSCCVAQFPLLSQRILNIGGGGGVGGGRGEGRGEKSRMCLCIVGDEDKIRE